MRLIDLNFLDAIAESNNEENKHLSDEQIAVRLFTYGLKDS